MPNRDEQAERAALRDSAKVLAAAEELKEEPMRRWSHPIPLPGTREGLAREDSQALTAALEQLQAQSQLLVDLLEAVNGLTAAVLARGSGT